ncbi:MAG: Ig-like domain-containing protein, partial [Acidobacteria bacterium]|nr:Ig-like domain-containing protein [Acidobacteriota bacterium]
GGTAMTYYPDGDPHGPQDGFPGSLFAGGHDWEHQVSEISIPVPVITTNLDELNTATTLQGFHDIFKVKSLEIPRTDLEYLPKQGSQAQGKLYLCFGAHYQEDNDLTHSWCETNLAAPQIAGKWKLANRLPYSTNDYLFEIPAPWANVYTPGKRLGCGRFRDGGWSGQGPSLFAIGPWEQGNPPIEGTELENSALILYSSTLDLDDINHTMGGYHHSDEWSGGAWLTAGDKSAVIFVGTKGTGTCWYGFANGVVWPEEPPYPPIPPPPNDIRGWWSTSFKGQFIFYDTDDLASVASGAKEPWEPQPYAALDIDQTLFNITSTQQKNHLGAAAFDRTRGYLYVMEYRGDNDKCLAHVWKVKGAVTLPPFGEFSSPQDGAVVSSSIPVTGWALDDVGIVSVKIYRQQNDHSVYTGEAVFSEGARPDIEKTYPNYPFNNRAGWGYMLLTNFLPNNGSGTFTFYAEAIDIEGNRVILGSKTITCDNIHAVKPFGAIETPAQGGIASGKRYLNWGWALTPLPNHIPTDGSTIDIYVDNKFVGCPIYNNYREDILNLFPGYTNSNGAVGYFYLDTTRYKNGVHTIHWIVTDNSGNTDGIGSRYFIIKN